jgi:hypothetical protein
VVLLFATAIFIMTYCEERADIYLLPKDFNGTATVFFNEPAGTPENRSGEKRTFKIPASELYIRKVFIKRSGTTITM